MMVEVRRVGEDVEAMQTWWLTDEAWQVDMCCGCWMVASDVGHVWRGVVMCGVVWPCVGVWCVALASALALSAAKNLKPNAPKLNLN